MKPVATMTSDEENAVKMVEANPDDPSRKPLRQVKGRERVHSPEHQSVLDERREWEAIEDTEEAWKCLKKELKRLRSWRRWGG